MEASVSVVIPCYRCSDTIERAVDSVAKQTLRPSEVILVDDASGDNTLEVLKYLQDKYSQDWIKIVALKHNGGPGCARNEGWNIASQDYIALLDADDAWHQDKIKEQYQWMLEHPDVILSAHPCKVVGEKEQLAQITDIGNRTFKVVSRYQILSSNHLVTSTWMIKSNITYRFNTNLRITDDYLFLLEVILNQNKTVLLDFCQAYRFRPYFSKGGIAGNLWKTQKELLNNYKLVWKSGKISDTEYCFFSTWSLPRFLRRILINAIREYRANKSVKL